MPPARLPHPRRRAKPAPWQRHHRHVPHRRRPAQPDGRRHRRQPRQGAGGARRGGEAAAPTCWSSPSSSSPAIRPRISSSSRRSRTPAGRAVEALASDTADGGPGVIVGSPWPEDGKVYNAVALLDGGAHRRRSATRSSCPTMASSTSSASSPRAAAGPGRLSRRPPRPADLRGHLVRPGPRVPDGDRRRDADRAERLALFGTARPTTGCRSPSPASSRPACRSSMSTSAAARTNWSSTAAPSASTPTVRSPSSCRSSRSGSALPPGSATAAAAGAASTGRSRRCPDSRRRTGAPAFSGLRDYVNKNGFPGVVLGLSGGIDSAVVRGDGGRCARARARPLRDAALSLHLEGKPERRRRDRRGARRPLRHRADRGAGRGFRGAR